MVGPSYFTDLVLYRVADRFGLQKGPFMESSELKCCRRCRQSKPISAFSRDRSRKDGRRGQCKECDAAASKARSRQRREADAARRAHIEARPDEAAIGVHRLLIRAHSAPAGSSAKKRAARDAALLAEYLPPDHVYHLPPKPDVCPVCGRLVGRDHIHNHHEDYDEPLEVIRMCASCHASYHAELKRAASAEFNTMTDGVEDQVAA